MFGGPISNAPPPPPGTVTALGVVGPDGNLLPQTTNQYLQPGDVGYSSNPESGPQLNSNYIAGSTAPVFTPAPFAPSPNALTPAQNAAAFVPPSNTGIIPPSAGAFNPNFSGMSAGKGSSKGSQGMQPTVPAQGPFPGTAAAPMDFHTQLQQFINSGLLGSQQRLSG